MKLASSPLRPLAHSPDRTRAFTLLEVVLALALTVIVVTMVASAMYTAYQIKNSINTSLDLSRNSDVAADLMAQEIANALPPTVLPPTATKVLLPGQTASSGNLIGQFSTPAGTPNDTILDFFTSGPEPKADLTPDVREIQYALVNGPKGTKNLVRRAITNLLPSATPAPLPPDVVIAQNIVNVTFTFNDGINITPDWNDTQDATQSTPQSITLPLIVILTIESLPRTPGQPNHITTRTITLDCGTDTSLTPVTGGTQ